MSELTAETRVRSCDCCTFPDPPGGLTDFPRRLTYAPSGQRMRLCRLCAATEAGNAYDYSNDDARTLAAICYVGNAVLKALADRGRPADPTPSPQGRADAARG